MKTWIDYYSEVLADKAPALRAENTHAAKRLMRMLHYRRPAGSDTESRFCKAFLEPVGARKDAHGNWVYEIPKKDGSRSPVMFSSHTDTVHDREGFQAVKLNAETGMITLAAPKMKVKTIKPANGSAYRTSERDCLGADCTTGVWLMLEMIDAGIPGLYVFHYGEECGGIGSSALASEYWNAPRGEHILDGIEFCIAFDRTGYTSIVTSQASAPTASDTFARSFDSTVGFDMLPDAFGVFTDSANYDEIISECTNISVGYFNQHTIDESQDLDFALALRATMLNDFDERALVAARNPDDRYYRSYGTPQTYDDWHDDPHRDYYPFLREDGDDMDTVNELIVAIVNDPERVVELLHRAGISPQEALYELNN